MKKLMSKFKMKIVAAFAVAMPAVFAHAEGSTPDTTAITTTVTQIGTAAKAGLEAAVTASLPYIVGALIAVISIYVAPLCWKWIKRIFGR